MVTDNLRDRIAKLLYARTMSRLAWHRAWDDLQPDVQQMWLDDADAVIRELDAEFLDFALWLSEELRGEPISRADAESCVQEWKWLHDESRWLKGEGSR